MATISARPLPDIPHGTPRLHGDPKVSTLPPFEWRPPDLSPGGVWYTMIHMENLQKAANLCADPDRVFEDGLTSLAIQQNNYDAEGPTPK
jgi:hypothetical protein